MIVAAFEWALVLICVAMGVLVASETLLGRVKLVTSLYWANEELTRCVDFLVLAKLIDGLESFPALVEVTRVSMAGNLVL